MGDREKVVAYPPFIPEFLIKICSFSF
jgi:hypothetical protein